MPEPIGQRATHCDACGKPAAGDGDRCIFCGRGLLSLRVAGWRSVYHPYSYSDALLANATLQAHGVNARVQHERLLTRQVVEVAEGEHLFAQEVLRQLRGVRTDTEYREWTELKQRGARRRLLACAMAAAAATVAIAGLIAWAAQSQREATDASEARRP
jgi:hypothetical protein